jgi:hypothetical protein
MAITRYGAAAEVNGKAGGVGSHAENGATASGPNSHAEGLSLVTAASTAGHAEGNGTSVAGNAAHAEGFGTAADGLYSHAEGLSSYASNSGAHAEGNSTIASGLYSHAEGNTTTASGQQSHAEGNLCVSSGYSSHAEGTSSTSSANYSRAAGFQVQAIRVGQQSSNGLAAVFVTGLQRAQVTQLSLMAQSTAGASAVLTSNGTTVTVAASNSNVYTVAAKWVALVDLVVVARRTDIDGYLSTQRQTFAVGRDSTGSARFLAGGTTTSTYADATTSAWTVVATIDTTDATYNYVKITCTAAAGTIDWFAHMTITETLTA